MIERDEMELQELAAVTALNLSAYLRSAGWNFERRRGRYADIFVTQDAGQQRTIAVPVFEYLDDHPDRILDAIGVIAQVERRPRSAVFHDLVRADHDAVRISSTNGISHTPLTISKSADLLRSARDLMSSSARAAEAATTGGYQAAFRGTLSSQVVDYLDDIAFVHDHALGYNIAMYSPVSVRIVQNQYQVDYSRATPFARMATRTLAQALTATGDALIESARTDSTDPFCKTVQEGVSANLCDALARLAQGGKGAALTIKWSLLRDSPMRPTSVAITHQQAEILHSAANALRQAEPSYNEKLVCYVNRLEREPSEFDGRARVITQRDGRGVHISVQFERENYSDVIQAFQNQTEISIVGDIHPGNGGLELHNPRILPMLAY